MTVGVSSTLAGTWLGTPIGTAYAELHTADPGAAGTTAKSVGDTTRKQITWNAASAGSRTMASMAGSWTNGGTSETITHVAVFDAATTGTFLYSFALTASQAWASGNTFSLTSHTASVTPIAA